jgi:predicted nucleic acid-binding protein
VSGYAADTNVYISADASAEAAEALARFIEQASAPWFVSSIVLAELRLGLDRSASRVAFVRQVLSGTDASRWITPSHHDWLVAADACVRLGATAERSRSFWNDALLASSCARAGVTLITANLSDFRRLQRIIRVQVIAPPSPLGE